MGTWDTVLEQRTMHSNIKLLEAENNNDSNTAEKLLRNAGFKIKLVTPTSFGTQIEFFKQYDADELKKILSTNGTTSTDDITIKIKGKSVFIIK